MNSIQCGTDEAGKGPVLGPMVVAAVATADRSALPAAVADSKTLTPSRRQELARVLHSTDPLAVGTATITVEAIDDPATDMNTLTATGHARAIEDALSSLAVPEEQDVTGLADACDTSPERFASRVTDACEMAVDLEARHGADDEDSLVAAASIVAKVRRDEYVEQLATEYDHEIGSGYPSDPKTRRFLETYAAEHGSVPSCARRSWSTCDDVLESVEQSGLEEF